tara:strand:- start:345 stop:1031 length:687 start_codon:yes stop_codon:yes gene_type:complete
MPYLGNQPTAVPIQSSDLADGIISNAKLGTDISAAKLTAGTIPNARYGTPTFAATNLTGIPAANLTGTLPAISGANLTGITTGKVLQAVTQLGTHITATSSTSWSTNMTVTITPTATSSKVLVMHAPPSSIYLSNNSNYGHAALFRETGGSDTNITTSGHNGTWGIFRLSSGNYTTGSAIHVLDSPNTTGSIDYKIRVKVDNSSLNMVYGHDSSQGCMSTLTAIEIGA